MPFPLHGTLPSLPDSVQSATENALLDGCLLARPSASVEAPPLGPPWSTPPEGPCSHPRLLPPFLHYERCHGGLKKRVKEAHSPSPCSWRRQWFYGPHAPRHSGRYRVRALPFSTLLPAAKLASPFFLHLPTLLSLSLSLSGPLLFGGENCYEQQGISTCIYIF